MEVMKKPERRWKIKGTYSKAIMRIKLKNTLSNEGLGEKRGVNEHGFIKSRRIRENHSMYRRE